LMAVALVEYFQLYLHRKRLAPIYRIVKPLQDNQPAGTVENR